MSPEELKTLSKILPLIIVVILIVCGKDLLSILRYATHLIKTNPTFRFISGYFMITLISNSIYYYLEFSKIRLHFLFDFPLYVISKTTLFISVVMLYGCVFLGILFFIKVFIPRLNAFNFFENFHSVVGGIGLLIFYIFFTIGFILGVIHSLIGFFFGFLIMMDYLLCTVTFEIICSLK